jgi:hypothetical protein
LVDATAVSKWNTPQACGVPNNSPTLAARGKTTYGLARQQDRRISVEVTKPNGRRRIIPDFRDAAGAYAWIIRMQHLTDAANPHLPGRAKARA